ncbi:MAG TPA: crossover junction endodeoxyribonuclease RuvC [Pseudohongiella sp.]|nr:crossover junction endodeoxyribonuclease RuvC [Pseudohongiella sp.]
MTLILGIDPGSRATGYGIIESVGNKLHYVDCGCIRPTPGEHPQRLRDIFQALSGIIEQYSPQECAIEEVFLGKSVSSALKLGQARGAAIVACMQYDLPLAEYPARTVKQAVTGSGAADKLQVQHMIKLLLGLQGKLQPDAADALAIAVCHANSRQSMIKVAAATRYSGRRYKS